MKKIRRTFFTGLLAVLPVFATFYILFWLIVTVETFLRKAIGLVLPEQYYWPGMGGACVVLIFAAGILLRAWVVRRLFERAAGILVRIPIVKSVYGAFRDVMHFVSESGKGALKSAGI